MGTITLPPSMRRYDSVLDWWAMLQLADDLAHEAGLRVNLEKVLEQAPDWAVCRAPQPAPTADVVDLAILSQDFSADELADMTGLDRGYVCQIGRKLGLPFPSKHRTSPSARAKIVELHAAGLSAKAIVSWLAEHMPSEPTLKPNSIVKVCARAQAAA